MNINDIANFIRLSPGWRGPAAAYANTPPKAFSPFFKELSSPRHQLCEGKLSASCHSCLRFVNDMQVYCSHMSMFSIARRHKDSLSVSIFI